MNAAPLDNLTDILLVEDSPGDARLTREAFADARLDVRLSTVRDGEEAMAFLRRQGDYTEAPRPDLVLLDLNMPRKNGREVLEEIRSDDDLRHLPVVVLTTSNADRDILDCYRHWANCYVVKPMDFERFMEVVQCIENFWLSIVRLPCPPPQTRPIHHA